MSVTIHELIKTNLPNRRQLKRFIPTIFLKEGKSLESLTIIFCSDEYLLEMNKKHLKHDFYTDIITFDLSDSKKSAIIGELYISIDRVKENASSNNVTFYDELIRVIFHGALHLCGYKDKIIKHILEIRRKENEYIILYHL